MPLSRIYNFSSWFKNNVTNNIWSPKAWDSNTNSFTLQFDEHSEDLYLISKDTCLGISEYLKSIQSFFSYENVPYIFNINNESYCFNTNKMYKMYSGEYNKFFDKDYSPYYIEYVVNDKPTVTKIFDTIEYYGDMFEYDTSSNTFKINHQNTFDSLDINNEYQTGHLDMCTLLDGKYTYKNIRKKLRQWRAIIPRENGTRNRIVNPWAKIRISKNSPKNEKTILHNINVKYSTV